jgi:DNA-binding CsgD family transcriptional regulator
MNNKTVISMLIAISLLTSFSSFSQVNREMSPSVDSLLTRVDDNELPLPQRFYYAQKAYNIALENGNKGIIFTAQIQMYEKKKMLYEYAEAFNYLQNAYAFAQKEGNTKQQMIALNHFGQFYADTDQLQKSVEEYEKLGSLAQQNEDFYYVYLSKLNLSELYCTQKKAQKTIEYAESARDNAYKARRYCKGIALSYINLAWGYFLQNDYPKTHYFMDSAKMILDTMTHLDKHITAELLWLNGRIILTEGKEKEAMLLFKKCVALEQDCEKKAQLYLAQSYEKHGNYAASAACYRIIAHLDSMTLLKWEKESIKNMASVYQLSEEKHRNETLKNEQFRLYASIPIGFLIVLVFYQRYKNAKAHKALLESQLEMSEKTRKLQELEQHKLQQTVEIQQEDLRSMAVDITQKNEFLVELEQKIHALNAAMSKDNFQELEALVRQNALNNEQNIVEFKWQVEALNSAFYERLRQRAADISPTEREICGLIRLNLSSKEIASIRNIEPKSVDMSRYRLRQKLNLKQGEDLTTVLKSI